MALLSELTTDQLNALRSGRYQTFQFVCLVPDDVAVQFQPDAAPTSLVYAQITVGDIITGSMSNIRQGQLVIYSSTADYQATETFRTRVRKVDGTSILFVGENSQELGTGDYVTVINTYEVRERLRNSVNLLNWDIPFRRLLPIETALPSAVVLTNDETEYTPPANAIVMDEGASSIAIHAWESSNPADSFDDDTIAQPTITLEAGAFRWLRYTFTDNLDNTSYRVIPVWTVPRDYSGVVALGFGDASGAIADISFDAELGWSATVPAWSGINTLLNKTYCVIASDEWYGDERLSIRTNIDFVGYLQNENSSTSGDEEIGRRSETRFTVEGFGHQLARQNVSPITIIRTAGTPTAWDEIQNPTPARMLSYRLTEYSTILTLCSLTIPADDGDFISDDQTVANGKALDDVRTIAEVINAELQFDVDGRLDLCRNLNFLDDIARNAADVVATMELSDFVRFEYDYDYSTTTSNLTMVGGAYDSTADRYDLYEADAPAVARLSEGDPVPVSNQVLLTDSTPEEARIEIGQRAANYFAYNNPTYQARGTLKDEWHGVAIPDVGSWFCFDVPGADTARGKEFTAADRWQFVQLTVTTNSLTGRRQVDFVARHETRSTGAMIRANPIENDPEANIIYYPAVLAPYTGENLDYTDGNWYDSQDPTPPSDPTPVPAECELGGLRIKSGTTYTTQSWGTLYVSSLVRGSGRIGTTGGWCHELDFRTGNQSFVVDPVRPFGNYVGGSGWEHEDGTAIGVTARRINIQKTSGVPSFTANRIEVDYSLEKGPVAGAGDYKAFSIRDGISNTRTSLDLADAVDGDDQTFAVTGSFAFSQFYIAAASSFGGDLQGYITIHAVRFYGSGVNPFGSENCDEGESTPVYGDAFYYSEDNWATAQAYGTGDGLLIEGIQPSGIPPFNPSHEYFLPLVLITGLATVTYEFESPYDLALAENWSLQIITCEAEAS